MKLQRVGPSIAAGQPVPGGLQDGPCDVLLDPLGDLAGERVLVLGPDIEVMCALIRRGCHEVTELEQNQRPETHTVDLVIVPSVRSTEVAVCAISHARRGLVPTGRILLRTEADPSGQLGRSIERALKLHGFSLIRVRRTGNHAAFSAELPLHGPLVRPLDRG